MSLSFPLPSSPCNCLRLVRGFNNRPNFKVHTPLGSKNDSRHDFESRKGLRGGKRLLQLKMTTKKVSLENFLRDAVNQTAIPPHRQLMRFFWWGTPLSH